MAFSALFLLFFGVHGTYNKATAGTFIRVQGTLEEPLMQLTSLKVKALDLRVTRERAKTVHGHIVWDNVSETVSFNDSVPLLRHHDPPKQQPERAKTVHEHIVWDNVSETVSLNDSVSLVVLVLSARDLKNRRGVIRETWGKGHSNVFFVVGKHCPYKPEQRKPWVCEPKIASMKIDPKYNLEQERLTQKLALEDNVIVVDMVDVYRNMAEKLKLGYIWVFSHTTAQYTLKMDDDSFARVDSVQHWLMNRKKPPKYEIIAGNFRGGGVPRSGKWAEKIYKPNTYPPWPIGSGHIVSRPVIEYLYNHLDTWVSYQGEDTSLGIWMEKVRLQMNAIRTKSNRFITHSGNCHDKKKFVIGHSISTAKLRACYKTMDEYKHVSRQQKQLKQYANLLRLKKKDNLTHCYEDTVTPYCIDAKSNVVEISHRLGISNMNNMLQHMSSMLRFLDTESQKHNFSYCVCGGSLIGTLRHFGFIPFDGDTDISMSMSDYAKFKKNVKIPNSLWIQDSETDARFGKVVDNDTSYAKLRLVNSDYVQWSKKHKNMHNGLQIDIFIRGSDWGRCAPSQKSTCCYPSDNMIFPLKRHRFENFEVNIPNRSDEILTNYYGKWQTLPKVKNRFSHQGVVAFEAPSWVKKLYPGLFKINNTKK